MSKKVYPTILTRINDGTVLIEVPDMEILTQGKDYADAIMMARDAIGLKGISLEDAGEKLPEPSELSSVCPDEGTFADEGKGIATLVDVDFLVYRRKNDNRMVRRNVTLPNWLNQEAEKAQLNVSKVLQEALMEKLNVGQKVL